MLLSEMDGFMQNNGVMVIGATNIPESLDKALVRPGRLDRQIHVPMPDLEGRRQILEAYLSKVLKADGVDVMAIVKGDAWVLGCRLANLVNDAALKAAKDGAEAVVMHHIDYAKDRITMGSERKSATIPYKCSKNTAYHEGAHALVAIHTDGADPIEKATIVPRGNALGIGDTVARGRRGVPSLEEEDAGDIGCPHGRAGGRGVPSLERKSAMVPDKCRKKTAYHEGGHALVAIHTDGAGPFEKATIVPRGNVRGMVTQLLEEEDDYQFSRKKMLVQLDVLMGGRVAEELILGESEVTSGTSSDLSKATQLAKEMVTRHGMSSWIGPVSYDYDDRGKAVMSERTSALVDEGVKELLDNAYKNAKTILTEHNKELHALANALLKHETLTGDQIMELVSPVGPVVGSDNSQQNPATRQQQSQETPSP